MEEKSYEFLRFNRIFGENAKRCAGSLREIPRQTSIIIHLLAVPNPSASRAYSQIQISHIQICKIGFPVGDLERRDVSTGTHKSDNDIDNNGDSFVAAGKSRVYMALLL